MIRTEKEYQAALRRVEENREFAGRQRQALTGLDLRSEEVERGMEPALSFSAQLEEEVAWYEHARRGDIPPIAKVTHLGRLLIALRIKNGLTQRELADRLHVSEAQVSRDERNEYHGITVERAQRVLDALGEGVIIEGLQPAAV